jgi:hypothetical protein
MQLWIVRMMSRTLMTLPGLSGEQPLRILPLTPRSCTCQKLCGQQQSCFVITMLSIDQAKEFERLGFMKLLPVAFKYSRTICASSAQFKDQPETTQHGDAIDSPADQWRRDHFFCEFLAH